MPQFRGDNRRAQTITAPAWVVAGPAETGKTWAALWRLDSEARRVKGGQFVIVRKLRSTMDATVLGTWRKVIALRGGVADPFGGNSPRWYDYTESGSRVWVFGLDNADKLLSGEFDGIYVNQAEELSESDWETIASRATGRGAVTDTPMLWGDCNPGPEDHWIIRRRDAGTLAFLTSRHEDNPTLYDEPEPNVFVLTEQGKRSMAVLDALTGVRYQRLRLGRWVGAEGQFFTEWGEAHIRRAPEGLTHHWAALDYGFAHPLAFGVFGRDDAGNVYLLGEHVAHKWLLGQHAGAMDELLARLKVDKRGLVVYAGHDCWASRGGDDPETIADKLRKHGYALERATVDRVNGAQAVLARLGNSAAGLAPSLFVDPSCAATIAAMPRMVHSPRNAEDVLKVDADAEGRGGDDPYDMLRYGVMAAPTPIKVVAPPPVVNRWRI